MATKKGSFLKLISCRTRSGVEMLYASPKLSKSGVTITLHRRETEYEVSGSWLDDSLRGMEQRGRCWLRCKASTSLVDDYMHAPGARRALRARAQTPQNIPPLRRTRVPAGGAVWCYLPPGHCKCDSTMVDAPPCTHVCAFSAFNGNKPAESTRQRKQASGAGMR